MAVDEKDYRRIDLEKELSTYDVEGKWNDYIGMQKSVIGTLREEGFFEDNVIQNVESGMKIRITAKGVKETLGAGKRFQALPKILKKLKLATLRYLPEIIMNGEILEDEVANLHKKEEYICVYCI